MNETRMSESRFDRHSRAIKTYHDLVEYWLQPHRMIGQSSRLNQSVEFIADQAAHCMSILVHLYNMNAVLVRD